MSASGKSSNRLSEYNRGFHTGSGHGPYAAEGARDRERMLANRAAQPRPTATRARVRSADTVPSFPVSLIALGFVAVRVAGAIAKRRGTR